LQPTLHRWGIYITTPNFVFVLKALVLKGYYLVIVVDVVLLVLALVLAPVLVLVLVQVLLLY